MGRWDLYLKSLVGESPQDFVAWLCPGALYIRRREGQFQTQEGMEEAFPMREIRSDSMVEAEYGKERMLINAEFQSTKDELIGERLLGYSYEATRLHNLPVFSCVIYPRHVFEPPQAPYEWHVPGRGTMLSFTYDSIELAEMPLGELEQKQLIGILPLLLCTKGGATRAVLERAITQLEAADKVQALALLRLIASIVFENADDIEWIKWRFANMHDYLLEKSWVYQELVKEGKIKGIEEGREKGIEEGRAEGIRQSIQAVVDTRFPALADLAKERIEHIQSQDMLQKIHI
ncbi:MAG: Rpn family recombination-promoting nuclease/putative transposase, partial [Ktedonobacteraceae bacterium]